MSGSQDLRNTPILKGTKRLVGVAATSSLNDSLVVEFKGHWVDEADKTLSEVILEFSSHLSGSVTSSSSHITCFDANSLKQLVNDEAKLTMLASKVARIRANFI